MSVKSEHVKSWRKRTKKRIIESMGGRCQICGYDKCDSALSLHHLNPNEKEVSLGSIRANPRSWVRIVDELRKCILLCNNCHSEVHDGCTFVPDQYEIFNDNYVEYKLNKFTEYNKCDICGNEKPVSNKYCSLECSSRSKFRVDWDNIDLESLYTEYKIPIIAEQLGISDSAVHKRLKKLGLK